MRDIRRCHVDPAECRCPTRTPRPPLLLPLAVAPPIAPWFSRRATGVVIDTRASALFVEVCLLLNLPVVTISTVFFLEVHLLLDLESDARKARDGLQKTVVGGVGVRRCLDTNLLDRERVGGEDGFCFMRIRATVRGCTFLVKKFHTR